MNLHAKEIELLVLGSSHSYYGINPEFFPCKSFSLANVSQDLKRDFYLLNKYVSDCTSLQYAILSLSYFTLFSNLENIKTESNRLIYYSIYMGYGDNKLDLELMNNGGNKFLSYYLRNEDIKACDEYGFCTNHSLENRKEKWQEWKNVVFRHTKKNDKELDDNIAYLANIISLCRERNVELIFVTTPTMPEYYNNLDLEQLNVLYETVKKMTEQYDNITYVDLLRDDRFSENDFYDVDHLSDIGAEKLTMILSDIIHNK